VGGATSPGALSLRPTTRPETGATTSLRLEASIAGRNCSRNSTSRALLTLKSSEAMRWYSLRAEVIRKPSSCLRCSD